MGLLGNGALYAPLLIYVSRWFDRRRGTALALISSGQYIAGIVWPSVFERGIERFGWQTAMLGYAGVTLALILPLTLFALARRRSRCRHRRRRPARRKPRQVLGLPPNRGAGAAVPGRLPVLRPDGDAVVAPGGVLQRPRHRAGAGRGDAVGDAGLRVRVAAVLGLVRRPLRRAARGAGRLGVPGGGDRLLPADAERGRVVRRRRRLRARLLRHHPVLRRWRSASCSRHPRRRGACRRCCSPRCAAWRSEAGWAARCTTISATTRRRSAPAWCSTSAIWSWWDCWCCVSSAGGRLQFAAAE